MPSSRIPLFIAFLIGAGALHAAPNDTGRNPSGLLSASNDLATLSGTITRVRVVGTPQEGADSIRAVSGLREGDPFDASVVRLSVKRIYLTGSFADVRVYGEQSAGGVVLTIVVVPERLIGEIEIRAESLPESRLLRVLPFRRGDRLPGDDFKRGQETLRQAAAELGYPKAQVSVQRTTLSPLETKVVFDIKLGPPTTLSEIIIEGDFPLSKATLLDSLGLRVGAPFDRLGLDEKLRRLLRALHDKRYLNAEGSISTRRDKRGQTQVKIQINARARYRVVFAGQEIFSNAELRSVVNENLLEDLKAPTLERARRRIVEHLHKNGFARARVRSEVVPSLRHPGERDVRFLIQEGPRVFVRSLSVAGSDITPAGTPSVENELWRYLRANTDTSGLFGRAPKSDVEDAMSTPSGNPQIGALRRAPFVGLPENLETETLDTGRLSPLRPPEEGGGFGFLRTRVEPFYTPALFARAARHIENLYRKDGFLDVSMGNAQANFSDDSRHVDVQYTLTPGVRFNVGTIRFEPLPKVPLAELLGASPLAPGAPLDRYALEQTRVLIERGLRERGFPFANVSESIERDPKNRTADVVFAIEEGTRVTLGQIRLRGNDRTRAFVLLDRASVLREGKLYRASAFNEARAELLRSGLFTSVTVSLLDDDNDKSVRDVLIEVHERPRYSLEAGVGASLEDGPRSYAAVNATNVFGFGLEGRIRAQLNYPRLLYAFVYDEDSLDNTPRKRIESLGLSPLETAALFTEGQLLTSAQLPKVYGLPFPSRLHLDAVGLREIRPAFTLMKGSVLLGLDTRPFSWLRVEPQLEAEASDFDCASDLSLGKSCGGGNSGLTRRQDAGRIGQLSARVLSSIDGRDDPFRPHSGFFASFTADFAFGGGELRTDDNLTEPVAVTSNFIKLSSVVSGYVPLAENVTWATSFKAGNIFSLGDPDKSYVPLYKRFYSGGTGSVRGFREDQVLPVDDAEWPADRAQPLTDGVTPSSLGGNFFLNARTELRVALVGDVDGGLFLDAGELAVDPANFAFPLFAIGGGVGVRYNTPVGPLAVDVGMKLRDGRRQLPSIFNGPLAAFDSGLLNLHFSIGYF